MAGMQFEYDEQGGTFYYFLLSFIALVLIPATYYLWPRSSSKDDQRSKRQCHCEPCKMKGQNVRENQPWTTFKRRAITIILVVGWMLFAYVAYKTSQVELDFTEFDPFHELEIDPGAEVSEIKKAYHKLSLKYHPDRGSGNPQKFMRISKAYQALTNEEARKNLEEYGNPDGPTATHFGIALPKWIVEKQNSVWGTWWYRSIKYSAQQVLINTTKLYYYFLRKSPNMILKRVLMVLTASYEFNKRANSEIIERPSDNVEIPELLRDLSSFTGLTQNCREMPFSTPYSVKARALLTAHFLRMELPSKTLEQDKQYILKKCPYLLNEMISVSHSLSQFDPSERAHFRSNLDTLENIMKLSQMVVQALWCLKSPLLQLPHITEDMLRHFVTKKRNIRSLKQFVSMEETERRLLLRQLTDSEYRDVMNVCAIMPSLDISVSCEVKGEEDQEITAGSIVTVSITLTRRPLFGDRLFSDIGGLEEVENNDEADEKVDEFDEEEQPNEGVVANGTKAVSLKQSKWADKKKKSGTKKPKKKQLVAKVAPVKKPPSGGVGDKKDAASSESPSLSSNNQQAVQTNNAIEVIQRNEEDNSDGGDESSCDEDNSDENGVTTRGDDEDEWMQFQKESKKDAILETKSKETHIVHCPFFPSMKYEWWWMYMADMKKKQLVAGPIQICTLAEVEEKEFQFVAPLKLGTYQYLIYVRSDSYMGLDQSHPFKIEVKEAKKIEDHHPQWVDDDDEEKQDDQESGSNSSSDDEQSDSN